MYFVKRNDAYVPTFPTKEEAALFLPLHIEYGMLNGRNLAMLEQVISLVFMPLFGAEAAASTQPDPLAPSEDFMTNLRKFASHMRRLIHQIDGDVKLKLPEPDLATLLDVNACMSNSALLVDLDKLMDSWTHTMETIIHTQLKKSPVGPGPLAELDYWVERSSTFTALYEQLELDVIKAVIALMTHRASPLLAPFDAFRKDLLHLHIEAKDNVKFLSTLERHFKTLTTCVDLNVGADLMPSMMNALRMVWIISRHYNTDQRLVPLMERIAWLIADKVAHRIDFRQVLRFA